MADPDAELRLNQIADLAWMMQRKKGILAHDPGVGKTPPVCVYIYWLWLENKVGTCWSMPKSLLKKNKAELLRFTDFKEDEVVIIDGDKEDREECLRKGAKVLLMGFKRYTEDWQLIKATHPHMGAVIIDESHLGYTTWDSKNCQELYKSLHNGFEYLFVMTGSFIKGRLTSAFPIIHMIEPRYYGSLGGFKRFHEMVDGNGMFLGWQNHDKIGRIMYDHGIRRTFVDEYGPEAKVLQLADSIMDPVHKSIYQEWHDKAMLELEDEFLAAPNAAVHALRARQILAHPETFLIPRWGNRTTARDERLITELQDVKHTGERYVLFSCFVPEIERLGRIGEKVGLRTGLLHGGITSARRSATELSFRNGELDFLAINPTVAGVGYNWPFLQRLGFTSLDYGDDSVFQAYRRGIRGARDTALLINFFGYKNTVDWRIRSVIEAKSRDANKVNSTFPILEINRLGVSS